MKKMLKSFYCFIICIVLIFISITNTFAGSIKFNVSREIGEFTYKESTYGIKKLHRIPKNDKTYYCLDINNDYPNNHSFDVAIKSNDKIASLLFYGYPNQSPSSLGLKNKNDAYVATQIALWSLVENFDSNKIITPKKEIKEAVKSLLNTVELSSVSDISYEYYYTNSGGIQDIVSLRIDEPGTEIIPPPPTDETTPPPTGEIPKPEVTPPTDENKKPAPELG